MKLKFYLFIIFSILFIECNYPKAKIDYIFIEKENKLELFINSLVKSIENNSKKDFIELLETQFETANNSSPWKKYNKFEVNKNISVKPDMNEPFSTYLGLLFDNEFSINEYNRNCYSKNDFNVTASKLPYVRDEIKNNIYITLYFDKIDLASIDLLLSDNYRIRRISSWNDYGNVWSNNPKKKYYYFLAENNIEFYKDKELAQKYTTVKRNTELIHLDYITDKVIKINKIGIPRNETYLEKVKLLNDETILYVPEAYVIMVEDYFNNLKNWKDWIDKEPYR